MSKLTIKMSPQELLAKQTEVIKRIKVARQEYIIPLLEELEDLAEKTGTAIYLNETDGDETGQTYYPDTFDSKTAGDDWYQSNWRGRWVSSSERC